MPVTGLSVLDQAFTRFAQQPCLVPTQGAALTYRDVADRAGRQARRLAELGVEPGQRVGILLPHSVEHLTLYLACALGGYVACPLDPALPPARATALRAAWAMRYVCGQDNAHEWDAAPQPGRDLPLPSPSADFVVLLSSGTTGEPKGIVHPLQGILDSAASYASLAEHDTHTVMYHHFPMHYMAGVFNMFLCALVSGATVVVGERFDAPTLYRFWETPRRLGVNHLTVTPTMALALTKLFRRDEALLESLARYQGVVSTSSMLHDSTARSFASTFHVPLRCCYGVTEVGGSITLQTWEQALARESVGVFKPTTLIEAGTEEAPGPILLKTPFMMRGYFNAGGVVRGTDERGFFASGDLGFVKHGSLHVTGRAHDLIKKGGEFVALPLVEDVALRQPGVQSAAAVAVPDEFWGNKVVLFYVTRPDFDFDQVRKGLDEDLHATLKKVEIPDKVIPIPRMPVTSMGKPIKGQLLATYTV